MRNEIPQLRTVGVIAAELGEPIHRVAYHLKKLNVKPIGRAGLLRLFDKQSVEIVRQAIARLQQKESAETTGGAA